MNICLRVFVCFVVCLRRMKQQQNCLHKITELRREARVLAALLAIGKPLLTVQRQSSKQQAGGWSRSSDGWVTNLLFSVGEASGSGPGSEMS